jgi:RNA polymerase sigma-B factor
MAVAATTIATPTGSIDALFRQCREGDRRAREALVLRHMPLARRLARRYARSSLPLEDLTQVANLALVNAVDRYDPARTGTFETFAVPTILGELRRFFRDTSWSVHVTRGAQERSKQVHDAISALRRENGRAPTLARLSQYLELEEEDVLDALEVAQAYRASSLDAPAQEDHETTTLGATLGSVEPGFELAEDAIMLQRALTTLTARERRLLRLRFGAELTQSQIGALFGVSQMQISRLERATLAKLERRIGPVADA